LQAENYPTVMFGGN